MDLLFDVDDFEGRSSDDLITTSIPVLPPDILRECLQYLPVSSLPAVAQACRRLKVIVYSDELWESKLRAMGYGFGGTKSSQAFKMVRVCWTDRSTLYHGSPSTVHTSRT